MDPSREILVAHDRVVAATGDEWLLGENGEHLRLEHRNGQSWDFDREGRPLSHRDDAGVWHATLDLRLWGHAVVGEASARRLRSRTAPADSLTAIASWYSTARQAKAALLSDPRPIAGDMEDPRAWAEQRLAQIVRWDESSLITDREALREIYRPIPVLPPDQYQALVVQVTEGCPWDRCRFCDLYRGVPYRERSLEEVRTHVRSLHAWLGESAHRFDRVFLDQANALLLDTEHLMRVLGTITERWPLRAREPNSNQRRDWDRRHPGSISSIAAFVDAFHKPKSADHWRALHTVGLRRVYVGLESGSEAILQELGKPLRMEAVEEMVRQLHAGGVAVGLILLVGAGGPARHNEHLRASRDVLPSLHLHRGDQVYLSPLVDAEGNAAPGATREAAEKMRATLSEVIPPEVPIARYDLGTLRDRSPRT